MLLMCVKGIGCMCAHHITVFGMYGMYSGIVKCNDVTAIPERAEHLFIYIAGI